MIRPNPSPEVYELARCLGIESTDPAVGIVVHCRQLADRWVSEIGGVGPSGIQDIAAFESLITRKLSMVVEEIYAESDFDRITNHYARGKSEYVFAGLRARFDDLENPAFGVLIQRNLALADDPDQFVAVVDCREDPSSEKYARRYFTKWHEIAHRMTTHRFPTDPAYRAEDDPIETLVDAVASELGFYEPFLGPELERALANENWLTFEMIQSIIEGVFPEASFQSTLFACMRLLPTPMVYMELADEPLRIQKILPNAAAYAHWKGLDAPTCVDRVLCDREREDSVGRSTRICCGELVHRDSIFYRVASGNLLYDQIEHHLCDFAPPESDTYLGRFSSEQNISQTILRPSHNHRGILAHLQARRVPGKVIALLQY